MKLSELKALLAERGGGPKRRFSQNFLTDEALLDRIAARIPKGLDYYIEIGGGLGTLTERVLAAGIGPLTVIDLDDDMLSHLTARVGGQALVRKMDGAKIDFSAFPGRGVVLGNLPYQVSAPILLNTCEQSSHLAAAVFLIQREVAEKIAAPPQSRLFSPLGALIRRVGRVEMLFDIGPDRFYPPPKVVSTVVKLTFNEHAYTSDELHQFARTMRTLFSHRRKTLANVLKMHRMPETLLQEAGIAPLARIEELTWEELLNLAANARSYHDDTVLQEQGSLLS